MRSLPVLVVLAVLGAPGPPVAAQNLLAEKNFYVTDQVVEDLEVVGDSVYVGGHFHHVGRYTGPLAPVSIATGETIAGFPEANDFIFSVAPDGEGGWLVGGDFTEIGGLPRAHVARIRPDLTVDPNWIADADHRVYGFAVHDSTVYMHGFFGHIHGETRTRIGSVSLATGALTDWNPQPESGGVEDFFLDGDLLYVVGTFNAIGGQPRRAAAFDLTTGELTDFTPDVTHQVLTVAAHEGRVYFGGRFTEAGGEKRGQLAAFDAVTSALLPWSPSLNGGVAYDLAVGDSTLYLGGAFSNVNGVIHRALAELDPETGAPLDRFSGTTGSITNLHVAGDLLFVSGDFQELAGQDQPFVGAYDRTSGDLVPLPKPIDVVNAVAAVGDTLFVGGQFAAVSGIDREHFAAFHAETLELLDFTPDFDDIVWAIEANAAGDTLYVAGRFRTAAGTGRKNTAVFDLASGQLTPFRAAAEGDIYDLAVTDSLVYLSGTFFSLNGVSRLDLAAVDRTTGDLTSWDPSSSGFVNRIYAHQDTVWVGGVFAQIGGVDQRNFAAIDGLTGEVLDWGSEINLPNTHEVESFLAVDHPAYPNGALFMGGDFLNLGIGLRRGVAALDRSTGNSVYSWNPYLEPAFETEVRDFERVGDLLYVAGDFGGVFTGAQRGVAAIDLVTAEATNWEVDAQKSNAIDVSDTFVFVGGRAQFVQGYYHTYLAAFRRDDEAPAPPSQLTATPGSPALRVELAWSASPSGDVKDYVVYRTASAGADTTEQQVAVTADLEVVDVVPTGGEWFYRVFARDQAHNHSDASNEATVEVDDGGGPGPAVTTALHQNPTVTAAAEIVVVAASELAEVPTVHVTWPGQGAGVPVAMTPIPDAASAFRGPFRFQADGIHTIQTSVTTDTGGPYVSDRQYGVARSRAGRPLAVTSPGSAATLQLAPGSVDDDVWIVATETGAGDAAEATFGPPLHLRAPAVVEFRAASASATISRLVDGVPQALPTVFDAARGVLRASTEELGTFRVVSGSGATSLSPPAALRLELAGPNPFRSGVALRYAVPALSVVELAIYDIHGRRVRTLHEGALRAGEHAARWDGRTDAGRVTSTGIYFVRLRDPRAAVTRRLIRIH